MDKYVFRKQVKNRGCYAEIFFDIKFVEGTNNDLNIIFLADSKWEAACKMGISVFFEYFLRKRKGTLEVKIYEIKWMPADTNNLIVFYCSIMLLSDALNFQVENLNFDSNNGIFTFPEVRNIL